MHVCKVATFVTSRVGDILLVQINLITSSMDEWILCGFQSSSRLVFWVLSACYHCVHFALVYRFDETQ